MPVKITFTQKEQDALSTALDFLSDYAEHDTGVTRQPLYNLLDKMVAARTKESTKFHGVGVGKVLEMARKQFGERFKTPNMITKEWTIRMQTTINQNGVSEETARTAIRNCNWQGDIFAAKLIYQLAEMAVVAPRSFGKGAPAPTKKTGWMAQLEED
jgi:hypothetical protein